MKTGTTEHIKTQRLKRYLDIPLWQALGILEGLWHLTARSAIDGAIGKLSNEDIALHLEYDGDADKLMESLARAGYLDVDEACRYRVHDWYEHAPEWVRKRINRERDKACAADNGGQRRTTADNGGDSRRAADNGGQRRTTADNGGDSRRAADNGGQNPVPSANGALTYPDLTNPSLACPNHSSALPGGGSSQCTDKTLESLEIEFLEAWNSASGNVKCQGSRLTEKRRKSLRARAREPGWDWRAALAKFPLSMLEPGGWRPDVDWFLKPENVGKILEGKYDWKRNSGTAGTPRIGAGQRYDPNATTEDDCVGRI